MNQVPAEIVNAADQAAEAEVPTLAVERVGDAIEQHWPAVNRIVTVVCLLAVAYILGRHHARRAAWRNAVWHDEAEARLAQAHAEACQAAFRAAAKAKPAPSVN